MNWALTLNRHRLNDTISQFPEALSLQRNDRYWGHLFLRHVFVVAAQCQSLTCHSIVVVVGVVAAVPIYLFDEELALDICKLAWASLLLCIAKIHSAIMLYLHPERCQLDLLPAPLLFATADALSTEERFEFFKLQTTQTIATYLKEKGHPERILDLYSYKCKMQTDIPERWEDALVLAGPHIKSLALDHQQRPIHTLRDIARKFPNLEALTISEAYLDKNSLFSISTLSALRSFTFIKNRGPFTAEETMACLLQLPHLERLETECTTLSNHHLERLTETAPNLHTLILNSRIPGELTEAHVNTLRQFRQLTHLSLSGNFTCSKEAVEQLGTLTQLTTLTLDATNPIPQLQNHTFDSFGALSNLESLILRHIPISDRALQTLSQPTSPLHTLSLSSVPSISERAIRSLATLRSLHHLTLDTCEKLGSGAFKAIGALDHLKTLTFCAHTAFSERHRSFFQDEGTRLMHLTSCTLRRVGLASDSLQNLVRGCPNLETFSFSGILVSDAKAWNHLQKLPHLRAVSFSGTYLTTQEIREIAKCQRLESFSLDSIGHDDIECWENHPSLTQFFPPRQFRLYPRDHYAKLPSGLTAFSFDLSDVQDLTALHQQCPNLRKVIVGSAAAETFEQLAQFKALEEIRFVRGPFFENRASSFHNLADQLPRLKKMEIASNALGWNVNELDLPACVTLYREDL